MKLNKIFPKAKMNEVFNKFGFDRQDSADGITYANQYNSMVMVYRPRFQTGFFFLDCNAIGSYGIKIKGYKRKWDDQEYKECLNFIENTLLPEISKLKGPFNIKPDYFFEQVENLFSVYVNTKGERGNQDLSIPFGDSEYSYNYDYLKFVLDTNETLFFLNRFKMYDILLIESTPNKKLLNWYDFADRDKEGDELLSQMVENIAVFLKLKK